MLKSFGRKNYKGMVANRAPNMQPPIDFSNIFVAFQLFMLRNFTEIHSWPEYQHDMGPWTWTLTMFCQLHGLGTVLDLLCLRSLVSSLRLLCPLWSCVSSRPRRHPAPAGQRHAGRQRQIHPAGRDREAGAEEGPHRRPAEDLLLCGDAATRSGECPGGWRG